MARIVCPVCGSKNTVPIIYGLPTPEAFEKADAGKFVLGGCCVGPLNRACKKCGASFIKDMPPTPDIPKRNTVRALIDGYLFHDYSGWHSYIDKDRPHIRVSLNLGSCIEVRCDITITKGRQYGLSFSYSVYGYLGGIVAGGTSIAIHDPLIQFGDSAITLASFGYRAEISHKPFDVSEYIRERSRPGPEKYVMVRKGDEEEIEFPFSVSTDGRVIEHDAVREFMFIDTSVSDDAAKVIKAVVEDGDISGLGPWGKNANGLFECTLEIFHGMTLRFIEGKTREFSKLTKELEWKSDNGEITLNMTVVHIEMAFTFDTEEIIFTGDDCKVSIAVKQNPDYE